MRTFDKHAKVGKWEIDIDSVGDYGVYNHDYHGEGGELIFEYGELIDADGCYVLPLEVAQAIIKCGYRVDTALFC